MGRNQRAVCERRQLSVEKLHHQIRLRILSCSRMSENHREPEVPEEKVPVVECLDGLARITSKELAPIRSVKSGTLQKCLFHKTKSGCRFGDKCSYAHRQIEEHSQQVVLFNDDAHSSSTKPLQFCHHSFWTFCWSAYSSNTRQLGCVFQDMEPPKCILRAQTYGHQSDV